MTFQNGYTVSVQWGDCNYCDNKHFDEISEDNNLDCHKDAESNTAEVAIMKDGIIISPYEFLGYENPSDEEYTTPNVLGYVSPEAVVSILATVAGYEEPIDVDKLIKLF